MSLSNRIPTLRLSCSGFVFVLLHRNEMKNFFIFSLLPINIFQYSSISHHYNIISYVVRTLSRRFFSFFPRLQIEKKKNNNKNSKFILHWHLRLSLTLPLYLSISVSFSPARSLLCCVDWRCLFILYVFFYICAWFAGVTLPITLYFITAFEFTCTQINLKQFRFFSSFFDVVVVCGDFEFLLF